MEHDWGELARQGKMSEVGRRISKELVLEHEQRGELPTSIRFLFYELVQRGELPKRWTHRKPGTSEANFKPDNSLSAWLMWLRERRIIPWEWIVDETRTLSNYTGWSSVKDAVESSLDKPRLDPWKGGAPLILCESRSLAGVLDRIAVRYRVKIAATNGQVGGFLRTDIIPALHDLNDPEILYLGDLDIAGNDIERNDRDVLVHEGGFVDDNWTRLAINESQTKELRELGLEPVKKKDERYKGKGGMHLAWETEALGQTSILSIVTEALDERLPISLEALGRREKRQASALRKKLA
ncbi:MAG: hypothetical protein ACRDMH_13235 [Solirubrobacterales bacterium]